MTALLLSPHNDDAALFAAFTCYDVRPHVITVLRSQVQEERGTGISSATREEEDAAAMEILGCRWEQWPHPDNHPDWNLITRCLEDLACRITTTGDPLYDSVFVPLPELKGHDHHNAIGQLATAQFGDRIRFYATYTTMGKSETGELVEPIEGAVSAKLAALACYRSQSDLANCRPHFLRGLEEYLA